MTRLFPMFLGVCSLLAACETTPVLDRDADLDPSSTARGERDTGGDTGFDTGAAEEDESVREDRATLEKLNAELLASLGLDSDAITIEFIGRSKPVEVESDGSDGDISGDTDTRRDAERSESIRSMRAYNPSTGNEFRMTFSEGVLPLAGELADREGLSDGSGDDEVRDPAALEAELVREAEEAARAEIPADAPPSWSDNVDNRVRLSKTAAEEPGTTGTTVWPWRAIVRLSNGCTGTMIGPRHVITAGHCIYNRSTSAWMTFNVSPGQAGTGLFPYGSVAFPSSGFNWYFTPEGWRQSSPSGGTAQYDFGLLVLPQSIGNQTGWMGWWVEGADSLAKDDHFNRGYPACAATDSAGNPRTDDPGDPGSSVVCVAQHLYGDVNNCEIGDFSVKDPDGWSRRFAHSCDASGGQSGSAIYHYEGGAPVISGIHTSSGCGATAASTPCTSSDDRPLGATRITPEYGDIISFFRNWKP